MGQRAIVYVRVSTTKQADHDLSIPDQITHAKRYCAERGIESAGEYIDPGASARDDNRPEFQRMVSDVKTGNVKADFLLVHSFSRFFRESFGFAFYARELMQHGVQVISMTQETGEGAQGELMRQILSSFDEYQSAETAKHVSRTMNENARRGFWNGSVPPLGYQTYVAEWAGAKAKKKLEINAEEAEIVKLIFRLYVYGDGKTGPPGVKNTVSYLAAKGLTARHGTPFRVQIIQQILRRGDYIGTHYFNRRDSKTKNFKPRDQWIEMPVPVIVDAELFHAAQAQLDARNPKKMAPRIANSDILLTGVARCDLCGSPMRIRTGKYGKYRYYTCSKQVDLGKTGCTGITIPMGKLDDLVTDVLCTRVLQPDRIDELIGGIVARNSGRRSRLQHDLKDLHRKRREVRTQLENIVDAIATGGLGSSRVLQDRLGKLEEQNSELTRLISLKEREIDLPIAELTPKRKEAFTAALRVKLADKSNPKCRRAYLRLLLEKVVVGKSDIRISGPKAALAQQLYTDKPVPPSMVPTFMDGWCTRQESNL